MRSRRPRRINQGGPCVVDGPGAVVVVVPPEVTWALADPVAESIKATAGGVATAKRPAFSRNKRR
jgi:hypothetical protein